MASDTENKILRMENVRLATEIRKARAERDAIAEQTRCDTVTEIVRALRLEGFIYRSYGPRAADFIEKEFYEKI